MKIWKIVMVVFLLGAVVISSFGCKSGEESESLVESELAAVQRGDLSIEITASGNLALSLTDDLTFEIAGTVEEVSVEEGDTVKEGQVLARLDASEWEDDVELLEDKLTTAERQLTVKKRAVTTAELNLAAKERAVPAKERDLFQAQINVDTAQRALNVMAVVQEALDAVEYAERNVEIANQMFNLDSSGGGDATQRAERLAYFQRKLTEARAELAEVLADPDNSGVSITEVWLKQQALELTQQKLVAAGEAIEVAQVDVVEAQKDIEDARVAVADAQKDVEDAQDDLDEARATSLEITAPFDGFITWVNVEGGDEVMKGTVAVQIADPNKFEADVLVSEMDILQIKLGGEATVEVDAMQGMSLPAEVTHIAPTATIQAGVVNYEVKVEIKSLEAVHQEQRQQAMQSIAAGELPPRLQQAVDEGRLTREQAEEMMKQMQEGGPPPGMAPPGMPPGAPPPGGAPGAQGQTSTMAVPEDFQLREGLTVTVNILVEEKSDVLLVPNKAITRQGTESYVEVSQDGVVTQRLVQAGISDWQFTEITGGLSEGEQIVVPKGTTTTPATSQGRPPGMGMPFFGGPPPPPPPPR